MAFPSDPQYQRKLKLCIQDLFLHYVKPLNVLPVFHKHDNNILVSSDTDHIKAVTTSHGDRAGSEDLLDRLCLYEGWFNCLLRVLKDPDVKLSHVANAMEKEKEKLNDQIKKNDQDKELKIHVLEQELQQKERHITHLESVLKSFKDEVISRFEMMEQKVDRLHLVEKAIEQIESVEKKIEKLDTQIVVLSSRADTQQQSFQELAKCFDVNTRALEDTSSCRIEVAGRLQKVEDRITTVEKETHQDVERLEKKCEETETKVDTVTVQIKDLSSEIVKLKSAQQQSPVGFTASYPVGSTPVTNGGNICFSVVGCNEGNSYEPATCEFTAPRDGLYLTSLTLSQKGKGRVGVSVYHRKSDGDVSVVCSVCTNAGNDRSCVVGMVKMTAGERLFVYVWNAVGDVRLTEYASFSCCLVG